MFVDAILKVTAKQQHMNKELVNLTDLYILCHMSAPSILKNKLLYLYLPNGKKTNIAICSDTVVSNMPEASWHATVWLTRHWLSMG